MSDPNTTTAEAQKKEPKKLISLDNRNGVEYVKLEFEADPKKPTPFDGYGFAAAKFKSTAQFVEVMDTLCKAQNRKDESGDSIALELLQTAYNSKLRTKVKLAVADFPDDEKGRVDLKNWWSKKHSEADANGGLLFTVDEALVWIPGTRGLGEKKLRDSLVAQLQDLLVKQGKTITDPEVADIVSRIGALAM